jgi:hypothetical protein
MDSIDFTTPVGRIVWGSIAKSSPVTDDNTKQVKLDATGQPRKKWSFGVAFSKHEFEQFVRPHLNQAAALLFAQGVPPNFSWKITDGDAIDSKGTPYSAREGYAGCFVLAFNTELSAPPCWVQNPSGAGFLQKDAQEINAGDYVAVGVNAAPNKATNPLHKSGLYINPRSVMFVGYGQRIINRNAPDPNEMFANRQFALPPGASATPIGPAAGAPMPQGMQPPPQQQYQPAPPQQQYQPAPPQQQYQPAPPQQQYQPAPPQQQYQPAYDMTGMPPQQFPGQMPPR